MKYRIRAAAWLVTLLATFHALLGRCDPPHDLVAANTTFALDLFAHLRSQPGNLFFSPYGVSTALAVTYAGAREETEAQMSNTLHFANTPTMHSAFGQLQRILLDEGADPGMEFKTATVLWKQVDYPFRSAFFDTATNDYRANIRQADFATEAATACQQINSWIARQTSNHIQNVLAPGSLDRATKLVLANAVYFRGKWDAPFDLGRTKPQPFHLSATKDVTVPLMFSEQPVEYLSDTNFQAVVLPYTGPFDMAILLPREIDGLNSLETNLTPEFLTNTLSRMTPTTVDIYLPRFSLNANLDLVHILASMGMPDAFSLSAADFSGVDGSSNLFISQLAQSDWCKVDESGAEAAAATTFHISNGDPQDTPVFSANHPFLFLIYDGSTSSILFLGRLSNPAL